MRHLIALLFLGVFSVEIYGQSPPAAARGFVKALVYRPHGSKVVEQSLKGFDGRVLHSYAQYDVVLITSRAAEAWTQHARQRGLEVTSADHFDRIYLRAGITDARLGTAGSHPGRALKDGYGGRDGLWIVQFIGPILPEWQDRIASTGAGIFSYVQMNALLIVATDAEARRIGRDPAVQYIDVYQPFLKFADIPRTPGVERPYVIHLASSDALADDLRQLEAWSSAPPVPDRDSLPGELRVRARLEGGQIEDVLALPLVVGISQPVGVTPSDERAAMSVANNLSATGQPLSTPSYKTWLQSICSYCGDLAEDGFRVALADRSGLDGGTNGFHHPALPASRITWGQNFTPPSSPYYSATMADVYGHATMVATIVGGDPASGTDSGGFLFTSGVAPSAGIVMTTMEQTGTDGWEPAQVTPIADLARDADNHNAVVQNHSYNAYTNQYEDPWNNCATYADGLYTTMSQAYDLRVIDADGIEAGQQPLAMTVSSGNIHQQARAPQPDSCSGTAVTSRPLETLPPATAKNVIAVGSAENIRTPAFSCDGESSTVANSFSNLWFWSKRGTKHTAAAISEVPFLKPDLIAPGAMVTSLISSANPGVALGCSSGSTPNPNDAQVKPGSGTSFAAPVVAGAAVLASRRYAEDVKGMGAPDPRAAKPSLIKAMLIAGAKSMRGGYDMNNHPATIGALPNAEQGFGRVALDEVLSASPARVFINESQPLSSVGEEWSDTYVTSDTAKLVKIALVWSDPPAQPPNEQGTPLVNDLDLIVDVGAPCTARYVGNKLTWTSTHGEVSDDRLCTGAPADHANNVELVRFAGGGTPFTVRVRATTGAMTPANPQRFSLVVYNAVSTSALVPPANVVATATAGTVTIIWDAAAGAGGYQVERKVDVSGWVVADTVTSGSQTSTTDMPAAASNVVLYRVRATAGSAQSTPSNVDVAYVQPFADDPIGTSTAVRALHVVELRAAVNALAGLSGLAPPYSGAALDPAQVRNQPIAASDLTGLMTNLNTARQAAGLSTIGFSPAPAVNGKILADHIEKLRDGVQ